jgi:hypothetical protein
MFCRQQVAGLQAARPRIYGMGAEVVIVGPAQPEHIADFREVTGYDGPLFVDPSLRAFSEAGLAHGLGKTLHPLTFVKGFSALAGGFRQGLTRGDPVQLGGTFVLGAGPVVRFAWRDRFAGDLPEMRDVLAALESPDV